MSKSEVSGCPEKTLGQSLQHSSVREGNQQSEFHPDNLLGMVTVFLLLQVKMDSPDVPQGRL